MEKKQSDETLLKHEANDLFVSRKMRHELFDQYMNKVRWRLTNDNKFESNSRIVEWDDGSYGLFVGEKYYELSGESPGNQMVYTVNEDTMILQNRIALTSRVRNPKMPKMR